LRSLAGGERRCAATNRPLGTVEKMRRNQTTGKPDTGWLYTSLIFGLIIGVVVAGMTDQWWWATVGVLAGAAVGYVSPLTFRGGR
jgi:hypothetical protein